MTANARPPNQAYQAVFIRAPCVTRVGKDVQVLATVTHAPTSAEAKGDGSAVVVAVRQGNLVATSFHPELATDDVRWHERFADVCRQAKKHLSV